MARARAKRANRFRKLITVQEQAVSSSTNLTASFMFIRLEKQSYEAMANWPCPVQLTTVGLFHNCLIFAELHWTFNTLWWYFLLVFSKMYVPQLGPIQLEI